MNKNIIYLKEVNSYDDILKNKHNKIPLFLKKIIYLYKKFFNIITKKKIREDSVWIIPAKGKYDINKMRKIIRKNLMNSNNTYLISNELINNKFYEIMDEIKPNYITEEKIKKSLLLYILGYISNIQKKELSNLEITILVNDISNINICLIKEIAKQLKSLKIVSLNIYKFKKIEEYLYNEYGIAIQFSNSYKKSLERSKIIINFDFNQREINEYEIFDKAIIINCTKRPIKIKSKLFNGIIVNSCDIQFEKKLIEQFKEMGLYDAYTKLLLYASIIENEDDFIKIQEKIILDNIKIIKLIGNSGDINKNEFKNIEKNLTKI